jgi:hypothetical protein
MSSKKKSFLLHIDSLDILDDLTNGQAGVLFKAIKAYQHGEDFPLDSVVKIAFSPFKNQFFRDDEKYVKTCERRAIAGSKGGKQKVANASKCKQELANVADNKNKNKNKTNNKSDNYNKDNTSFINDGFDHWWSNYKKKADKKKALQKFKLITRGFTDDRFTEFVNMITKDCKKRFVNTEKEYVPLPTTYLTGERWNDEIVEGR